MARSNRKTELMEQSVPVITGLDFVQVTDKNVQTNLRLFLVIDPLATVPPLGTDGGQMDMDLFALSIKAVHGGAEIELVQSRDAAHPDGEYRNPRWGSETIGGTERSFLEFDVVHPGAFEPYELLLVHSPAASNPDQVDPFLSSLIFDFKQACETGFDCEASQKCGDSEGADFPVDYMARDFHSFRRALLDFAAQRYPAWREPIEADMATMLMEIMAHMGDEFAYIQDMGDAETRFGSALRRVSVHAMARLVDYDIDKGAAAHGEVVLNAAPGAGGAIAGGAHMWAASASGGSVPFNMQAIGWIHSAWNNLAVHNPNPDVDCLAKGQTSLLVIAPEDSEITPEDPDAAGTRLPLPDFLYRRQMMILSDPADASLSRKAHGVTITQVVEMEDPIILTGTAPTKLLKIFWHAHEAVPFDLPLDGLSAALNIGQVTAGKRVTEFARVGDDADIESVHAGEPPLVRQKLRAAPPLIEREGPLDPGNGTRAIIFRHGLSATAESSLRFSRTGRPQIFVTEIEPPLAYPDPLPVLPEELLAEFDDVAGSVWTYTDDLLESDAGNAQFTVEPGQWRTVKMHQLPTGNFAFRDYAQDSGWTLKFGFGEFGTAPADGTLLRIDYDTDPGLAGNISSFSIRLNVPGVHDTDPALDGKVTSVFNPLPFTNAHAEENLDAIRLNAPQAYRARSRRAVRPEDYSRILERQDNVQKAHSITRWTGSWSTDFVSVDPLGSIALSANGRARLQQEVDCIRLATRDARLIDPDYVDIDIEAVICVARGFYAGAVLEDVQGALAPPGFFNPDNFTFGQSLYRSALVAAVQAVPGVAHVTRMMIRVHGLGDWREFTEDALETDVGQIIRLQNDPSRSTLGIIRVSEVEEA